MAWVCETVNILKLVSTYLGIIGHFEIIKRIFQFGYGSGVRFVGFS